MKRFLCLLCLFFLLVLPLLSSPVEVTLGLSPVSSSFVDFFRGNNMDGAKSFMVSPYGASASWEVGAYLKNGIGLSGKVGVALDRKMETVYPKAYQVFHYNVLLGPVFRVELADSVSAFVGLEGGIGFVQNANVISRAELIGIKGGIRKALGKHLTLGVESRMLGTLSLTRDPYYSSIQLQTESLVVDLGWRF